MSAHYVTRGFQTENIGEYCEIQFTAGVGTDCVCVSTRACKRVNIKGSEVKFKVGFRYRFEMEAR